MKRHLTDEELIDLRFDTLDGDQGKNLAKHLKRCDACRKRAAWLHAKLGQLDQLREDNRASEELIARTLRATRGEAESVVARPSKQRIAWGRFAGIGIAAAAAVVALTVLPPLWRPKEPADMAALAEKPAVQPLEKAEAKAMVAQDRVVPRSPEPPPKPAAEARPKLTTSELHQVLMQKLPATGGAGGGAPASRARTTSVVSAAAAQPVLTLAPIAPPQPAAASVQAPGLAEQDIAADITVRMPSTSGTWLTGPQNAIRVRATRRDHDVDFLFVNQGSILAARIKVLTANGSNHLQTVFLPPLAKTNVTMKTK